MADTYRSPLLDRAGACELTEPSPLLDAVGIAWHYGNPLVEQRAAESSPVVVDRSHRVVLAVSGDDRLSYLNNLLSQQLVDAPAGFAASALDLDAQGHILHHADVFVSDDTVYLDVPAAQADPLQDYLTKMVFWSQVQVERTELALLTILGVAAQPSNAVFTRTFAWGGLQRTDVAVPRASISAAVDETGAQLIGLMAFTALRVRALEPELGIDLDGKSIPHESPVLLERAVHLNKGCYRGQETVSRVHNLGRAPRALVRLLLDGSVPNLPSPGDPITAGGRAVGRLGTIVDDCDYGPIALGLVKRSALASVAFQSGDCALSIDPDSLPTDDGERPGRAAINRLRGQ